MPGVHCTALPRLTFALSGHLERHHTLSTPQIPSAAQIAAARSALWHQNTPKPAAAPQVSDAGDAQDAVIASSISPTEQEGNLGNEPSGADVGSEQSGEGKGESAEDGAEHVPASAVAERPEVVAPSGIDVSDTDVQEKAAPDQAASVAILTQSGAHEFLNRAGLLLFAAKPQFAGVPAPTFVEATLGAANANPSLSASGAARTLLARLVADGSAVPLNLLGLPATTAESPDFIVSAAAFPFIFTLRGDKAWKQPPSTSGAAKVSPLAANTYSLLVENGPKTAYALTGDLGKEVTEAAVLRALSELWQQLRVVPVPQSGGKPTLWEPITTRFTKQLKTGANAGQPTALSTFVSLFLGQAILATEDEIETFLSPLAPRSRIRDVVHALSGARQLETITIEGKHHLHVSGDLPLFASAAPARDVDEVAIFSEDGSRIKKLVPKPRKLGTGSADRPKPFQSPADRGRLEARPSRGSGRGQFTGGAGRPAFNKPWEEEKQARVDHAASETAASSPSAYQDIDLDAGSRPETPRRAPAAVGGRPAFGSKAAFGSKPAFGRKPGFSDRPRSGGGDRPAFQRDRPAGDRPAFTRDRPEGGRPAFSRDRNSSDRPPFSRDRSGSSDRPSSARAPREGGGDRFQPRDARRSFTPRDETSGQSRPARPFGNKPGFGGKPAFGSKPSFPRKPFDPERSAGDRERRPFRREDGDAGSRPPRRTFDPEGRPGGSEGRSASAGRPSFPRDRETEGGKRPPFRKFDAPRTPRPPRDGDESRPAHRPESGRPAPRGGGFAGSKPFGSKPPGEKPFPRRDGAESASRRAGFTPREDGFAPRREGGATGSGSSGRREGGFSGKKPFSARSASGSTGRPFKPSRSAPDAPGASTFDKFKGNAKPWGKRPPARRYKPKEDEA